MPPKGGRKAPVKTVGKKIGRRSVPRDTEPDADSSSSYFEHEQEDGGHSDLEVTPPSSHVQMLQGSVTSVMTASCVQPAKKRQRVALSDEGCTIHLSDEQHDVMCEWLKNHDYLYQGSFEI